MRKAREPKSLARLVSRRAEPIEYRPHAQHRLQSYDDTFDLRYSAYLWSQAVIEGVYLRVIEKASHDVSTKLSSILNSLHFVPAAAGGVEVVHVSTDLSDSDRNALVGGSFAALRGASCEGRLVVELSVESDASYWSLLDSLVKSVAQRQGPHFAAGDCGSPLQQLQAILQGNGIQHFVLTFPLADRLTSALLVALVRDLRVACDRVTMICVVDHLSNRLFDDTELRGFATVTLLALPRAIELFEPIYTTLIVRGRLALNIPPALLRSLWVEFEDTTCCCGTFVKRLLLLVRLHLRKRRGLLMMVYDVDWMQSMNVLSRKAAKDLNPGANEVQHQALSELLAMLDPRDLQDSAIAVPLDTPGYQSPSLSAQAKLQMEVDQAEKALQQFRDQHYASQQVLQLMQSIVQRFVPPSERSQYPVFLLWPAILEPSKHVDLWGRLYLQIQRQSTRVPASTIYATVQDWATIFASDRRLSVGQWSRFLDKQFKALRLLHRGLLALRQAVSKSLAADEESSGEARGAAAASAEQDREAEDWLRQSLLSMIDEIETNPHHVMARKVVVSTPSASSDQAESTSLEYFYIYEQLLVDLASWMTRLTQEFAQMVVSLEGMESLTCVAFDVAREVATMHFNSCLRTKFMEGLLRPRHLRTKVADGAAVPEVCHFAKRLATAKSVEVAAAWYPDFSPAHASAAALTDKSKKRGRAELSKSAQEDDDGHEATGRGRPALLPPASRDEQERKRMAFVNSLHDLEKAGIISLRVTPQKVALICKQLFAGI